MHIPERVLAPGYWGDHSLGDFCRGNTVNYLPASPEEKIQLEQRGQDRVRMIQVALAVLNRYYSPDLKPIDILDHDVFDATQYRVGGLVRIQRERLWRDKKFGFGRMIRSIWRRQIEAFEWDDPFYEDKSWLGVLVNSDYFPEFQKRRIIWFSENAWKENDPQLKKRGYSYPGRVYIGQVRHDRTTDTWFGTNDTESIERIKRVELLVIERSSNH